MATQSKLSGKTRHKFLAIGSAHWDILGSTRRLMSIHDDVPGRIRRMVGGVAGPVAMKLAHLGLDVSLIAYAGFDPLGDALMAKLAEYGVKLEQMRRGDMATDVYMGIEAPNGLIAAIADCHSLEAVSFELISSLMKMELGEVALVVDGNLHPEALTQLAESSIEPKRLILVPASPGKIDRFLPFAKRQDTELYVNLKEANALIHQDCSDAPTAAKTLASAGFRAALVSNGPKAAAYIDENGLITALPPEIEVKRFTGAGDTLTAHHIFAALQGIGPKEALTLALAETAKFISEEDLDV